MKKNKISETQIEKNTKKLSFILEFYEAYRTEERMQKVAARLNMNVLTLQGWIQRYPHLRQIRQAALAHRQKAPDASLEQYVYKHLSPEAREAWDEIRGIDAEEDPLGAIREVFATKGEKIQKEVFLHSMVSNGWNQSEACRTVGIPLSRVRTWCEKDPEFLNLAREMLVHKKNFCESALMGLVAEGVPHAVTFVNKTLNADRGYSEKIQVEHSGQIDHTIGFYSVEDLDLDLETRKKILAAIRRRKTIEVDAEEAQARKSPPLLSLPPV